MLLDREINKLKKCHLSNGIESKSLAKYVDMVETSSSYNKSRFNIQSTFSKFYRIYQFLHDESEMMRVVDRHLLLALLR